MHIFVFSTNYLELLILPIHFFTKQENVIYELHDVFYVKKLKNDVSYLTNIEISIK